MAFDPHKRLPLQGDHIRIVTILPGSEDNDITISLDLVPFSSEQPPDYEALSYTWGSPEDPASIWVLLSESPAEPGEIEKSTIPVTQNLHVALKNLRYSDKPRAMWIDALCIDQHNNEEKSREVVRMNVIYRLARRVVIWLGPEGDDSVHAMKLIENVGNAFDVEWYYKKLTVLNGEDPKVQDLLTFDHRDLAGYYHLINRPWFERLWIRQEVTLANSDAIVSCGHEVVPWSVFRKGLAAVWNMYICSVPDVPYCNRVGFPLEMELMSRGYRLKSFFWQPMHTCLHDTKGTFGGAECLDPRDRIYAVIHMLAGTSLDIVPDYSLPVWEVYRDAVVRILQRHGNFFFLSIAQLQEPPQSSPTWIPDWSLRLHGESLKLHYFTHNTSQLAAWFEHPNNRTLRVAGVKVLTIDYVQATPNLHIWLDRNFNNIREALQGLISLGKLSNVDADHEKVARAFLCGKFFDSEEPNNINRPTLDDAKSVVSKMMSADYTLQIADFYTGSGASRVMSRLMNLMMGAQVFTAGDVIGLARGPVRPGDEVYVIVGCDHSVVVRKVPGHEGQNNAQVVGECYVDHVHQGQALFGPLPERVEQIAAELIEGTRILGNAYINRVTGDLSNLDPRLETVLPPDLFAKFQENLENDPYYRMVLDPEVLRRPGFDIEYLDLV